MAFKLASAFVEFSAKGISGVTSAIGGIRSALGMIQPHAMAAAGSLLALGGAGAGIGGLLKLAADAEAAAVSMGVMLGSAEKAKSLIAEITKMDKITPFSATELIEVSKTLLNFGVSAEQIMPSLDKLGNVAAGDANKLKSLALVFGQVASAGRMTGQDLMQFINAGFNPLKVLADKTGESMDSLRERMSKGALGIDEVAKAFNLATAAGGQFAGMNQKQSETLGGVWNALTGTLTGIFTKVGTAIAETFQLTSGANSITKWLEQITDRYLPSFVSGLEFIKGVWDELVTALLPALNQSAAFAQRLFGQQFAYGLKILRGVIEVVKAWVPTLLAVNNLWMAIQAAIYKVFNAVLEAAGPVFGFIDGMQDGLTGFLANTINWLAELISHWDLTWALIKEGGRLALENIWIAVQWWAENAYARAAWFGSNFFNVIRDAGNAVGTVFSNLWTNIQNGWQAVIDYFAGNPVEFDWTPMLQGFERSAEKFPEITKLQLKTTSDEIDRIMGEFAKRRAADRAGWQADTDEAADAAVGDLDFSGAAGAAAKKDEVAGARKGFEFTGLAQLAEKMQQEASNQADKKRQEQIAERQAVAAEKLAQKADGDGLKVQIVQVNQRADLNPAFG